MRAHMSVMGKIIECGFVLPLCALLLSAFVGCNAQQSNQGYVFLVLPRTLNNDFHVSLVAGAKAAAIKKKVLLEIHASDSEDDYKFQEHYLREAVKNNNVDGVVITPGHSTNLIPALRELDDQSIPFVIVDTPLELSGESAFTHYCGFVGTDNRRGGGLAAEYVEKSVKNGNVLLVRGVTSHRTSQDRESGFLEKIKQYPQIHIVNIVEGQWNYEKAKEAMRKLSRKELASIAAVFAFNDLMALGVAEVFRQHGLRPLIVGYDGILEAQSSIIDGSIDATVTQAPNVMGQRAVAILQQCIARGTYGAQTELTPVTLLVAARTLTAVSDL